MCVILDANSYSDFLDADNTGMRPLRDWLRTQGKLVYAPTRRMKAELDSHGQMRKRLVEYSQAGRVKELAGEEVVTKEAELTDLSSDDAHIVALALVARVDVLVSHDKNLHDDFKRLVKGKVYQNEKHKHLLRRDTCP